MTANQTVFDWNTNYEKFTEEYVMFINKHLAVKNVYKLAAHGFATTSLS